MNCYFTVTYVMILCVTLLMSKERKLSTVTLTTDNENNKT